jgi:3',5'-cyclic AMP phosphodiesterase CpdA
MDSAVLFRQDMTMLIAQMTDIHLGFEPGNAREANRLRLDRVIAALNALSPQPDVLLVTGDIADRGTAAAYAQFREAISAIDCPVYCCPGNHDRRDNFRAALPQPGADLNFVQYSFDAGELRVLVLDTLDEGHHGGAFCEVRAAWLKAELAQYPERPTLIAMHHTPIATGIAWMDPAPSAPWIERLGQIIRGKAQVVKIVCGHIHRPIAAQWQGHTLAVCAATASQLSLDFASISPELPDGRVMITDAPPAFALHYWNGRELITHYGVAQDEPVVAIYDQTMQPLVRLLAQERETD